MSKTVPVFFLLLSLVCPRGVGDAPVTDNPWLDDGITVFWEAGWLTALFVATDDDDVDDDDKIGCDVVFWLPPSPGIW